jgi:hypothetical protein
VLVMMCLCTIPSAEEQRRMSAQLASSISRHARLRQVQSIHRSAQSKLNIQRPTPNTQHPKHDHPSRKLFRILTGLL